MLIDGFTLGAQALNFAVLVWLMKRFLYQPVLHAIDAREKLIASTLADAETKKAETQKDRDAFQHKNEEFDGQRAPLLIRATEEAKAERQRLIERARKTADAFTAKRQEALQTDAQNLNEALRHRAQQEVFAITRKTLTELAGASLEERMTDVFVERLRELTGAAKDTLGAAMKTTAEPSLVRSTFELPGAQRATIQKTLNETFSSDIRLRFETAPDSVPAQIATLLALAAELFDTIALDQMAEAERAVEEAAATIPPEICARFETAPKLSDEDRDTIIEIARRSLARVPSIAKVPVGEPS